MANKFLWTLIFFPAGAFAAFNFTSCGGNGDDDSSEGQTAQDDDTRITDDSFADDAGGCGC